MEILKTKREMQVWSGLKKKEGKTICFVPTMGFLHKGHVSLLEKGRPLCHELVLSIFVNPAQFGPNEDLDAYPSDIDNDLALAKKAGVTAVFLPEKDDLYPEGFQTEVTPGPLAGHLCGKFRPIHFAGVATVVTKLFNIVMPDAAVFGEKDYQQLQIVRQLTLDLDFNIDIVAGKIIREKDGLAMSSRNAYLSAAQRVSARSLNQALQTAEKKIQAGETDPEQLKTELAAFIHSFDDTRVEYICFCDPNRLMDITRISSKPVLLALAVKVGHTRLIDNTLINR